MLTRRRFLGTVAALAAGSRVAPAAAATAPMVEWKDRLYTLPPRDGIRYVYGRSDGDIPQYSFVRLGPDGFTRVPRRDDGDTLLELR